MYLVTAFVFFMVGGTEALLIRIQLGGPTTRSSPETYNQLFDAHGTTMVFLFVVPMMAGFGNYSRPADDRRAGHGVPQPERVVVLDVPVGGIVFYASLFWRRPRPGGRPTPR